MSKVKRLSPFSKTVHVEADIPINQRDEFERAIVDIIAGEQPRMDALDRDLVAIKTRVMAALASIEKAINENPPPIGHAKRQVRFLVGVCRPIIIVDARRYGRWKSGACPSCRGCSAGWFAIGASKYNCQRLVCRRHSEGSS